jgi:O-methyltransferase involved in polyketide biosynthesis
MFDKNDPKKDITIFYNIDVPEINAIQKKVFKQSSHNVFIGKSVFDTFWMKEVPKDKPILFVSE